MKVEGTKAFDAAPEVVWEVLMDPERMAKLLPGVESFEVHDADHWTAAVKVPLGMGALKLKFAFEQVEKAADRLREAQRQGPGASVRSWTWRPSSTSRRTAMRRRCAGRPGRPRGPVGSMGQRVFQPIVNQQVTSVLDALEVRVADAKKAKAG